MVHLHGGRTAAVSDGWTENASLSGQVTTSDYANDQQATLLWYHDHAMGITRFNVYAGLAGLYIIRDAEEAAFREAWEYLSANPDATVYCYSKYERTVYRKLQQRYPTVCSEEEIEALFAPDRAVDLYFDVVERSTLWPTRDHSIKTLAKHLGFAWRDTDPSGSASIAPHACRSPSASAAATR